MKRVVILTAVFALLTVCFAFAAVTTERDLTVIQHSSTDYSTQDVVHRVVLGIATDNTPDISFWHKFTEGPYVLDDGRLDASLFSPEEIEFLDNLYLDHDRRVNIFVDLTDLTTQVVEIVSWGHGRLHGAETQLPQLFPDYTEEETQTIVTYDYSTPYVVIENVLTLVTTLNHTYQIIGWGTESPIILDLDNNNRVDVAEGRWLPHLPRVYTQFVRKFDMTGSGTRDLTEWMTPNPGDGLLVMPNAEGKVETALELFGTAGGFDDGYHKLATLCDRDNNGWVEGEELEGLKIWIDHNNNAICEPGELYSLDKFNIARISVNHENFKSVYETTDGQVRTTWDWWPSVMEVRKLRKR